MSAKEARKLFDAVMERIEGPHPDGAVRIVINQGEFLASLSSALEHCARLDALRDEIGWPEYIRRYYRIVATGPVTEAGQQLTPDVTYCVIDEAEPKTDEFDYGSSVSAARPRRMRRPSSTRPLPRRSTAVTGANRR